MDVAGDAPSRDVLDAWQAFALDIASVKGRERASKRGQLSDYQPLRMLCTGPAGTGKSSTIRAVVHAWREAAKACPALTRGVGGGAGVAAESTVLAAPTGCASFQMKHGAMTAHRAFGVPIGYCGPLRQDSDAWKRLFQRLDRASLLVLDEFSMLGRQFTGKIVYRVDQVLGDDAKKRFGRTVSLGGLDLFLAGHSAQCRPVGDEPLYKTGPYQGKGLNKPAKGERSPEAPTCSSLVNRACLLCNEILQDECGDVAILRQVHRVDDAGGAHLSEAERQIYADEAERFLEVTGRMADLTWTQQDHAWLSRRNRTALQATEAGRAELRAFDHAPLLMCRRKRGVRGEDGADQYNAAELRRLSARTGRPIVAMGAHHNTPKNAPELRPEALDSEEFRGLEAILELVEDARVLLMSNEWPEAGLMNGALGWVRGFMWPEGGDPNSADPALRAPICVFVEFDDVNMGPDAGGGQRTFFPDDPSKARWIPVYRQTAASSTEANVERLQFPLMLAWALTHWKAQGMTLSLVRISLGEKTAKSPGVGYVALTRVKHVRHLIFETDLPAWDTFQEARHSELFRSRLRFDLRVAAKFSRTLRRWGFCAADPWTREDADAASELLGVLRSRGQLQRARRAEFTGLPSDEDAFIWKEHELDFDGFFASAVQDAARGDASRQLRLEAVSARLRSELHMPAVRAALGCLIPEHLHPSLDGKKKPRAPRGGGDRVGVYLEADRWRVDLAEETSLSGSHPIAQGVLEFFTKVFRRVAHILELPLTCGTIGLGKRLGLSESVEHLCATVEAWQSWSEAERTRVRASREFLLPVLWDPEGRGLSVGRSRV